MTDTQRITLQHLEYLEALVLECHVTRAADRMGIGQPAMSTALARLRLLFRDPLLIRTSAGMEPTARALELVKRTRELREVLAGGGEAGRPFDARSSEAHFRIMASDGIAQLLLPELMRRIRVEAPQLRLTVRPGDIRRIAEYLRDGEADMVVGFVRHPPPELHQTLLYPQRLVCIAAAGHPEIRRRLTLKQFVSHPHVVWGVPPVPYPTMEVMVDEVLAQRGLGRRIVLRVSNVMLLADVVASSDMLAVVPERLAPVRQGDARIQVLALPFRAERVDVTMSWHERRHRDAAHVWLRSVLRDVGKTLTRRLPKVADA